MEGKGVVVLSVLLSILVLSELVIVVNSVSGTSDGAPISQSTLVLFNNDLVNGTYSNPNNYFWSLFSAVYDPVNGLVYAVNFPNNTVVIFDPKNYSIIGTIAVGREPVWITINSENGYLYVVNQGTATISVINPTTNKVVNTIYVGNCPEVAAYDPNNSYLYVVNKLSNGTMVVQLVNGQGVVKSIPVPSGVYSVNTIAYDPLTQYIILGTSDGVYAISNDRYVASDTSYNNVNNYIVALAIDPTNGDVYGLTSEFTLSGVLVGVIEYNSFNLKMKHTVVFQIPSSAAPDSVAYANGTAYVLVTNSLSSSTLVCVYAANVSKGSSKLLFSNIENVSLVTANHDIVYADGKLVLTLTTPTPFFVVDPQNGEGVGVGVNIENPSVLYNPVTGYVYVPDEYSNTLYVINPGTGKVVNVIPSILEPYALAYNPENGYLYMASYNNNTVAEINPNNGQVVWKVVAGTGPNGVLYNTYNNLLYVEYYGTSTVAVINPNTGQVLGQAQVGSDPVSMTFDPNTGLVYVANEGSKSVTVINGTQVINTINLNFNPSSLAFINGYLYIGGASGSSNSFSSPHISVYKDGKIIANISLKAWPSYITSYNGLIYVSMCGSTSIPYSSYMYVTNVPGYLAVIDGTTVVTYIKVGISPTSVAVTPNGTIYVANMGEGTVSEISIGVHSGATTTTSAVTPTGTSSPVGMQGTSTSSGSESAMSNSPSQSTKAASGLPLSSGLLILLAIVVIVIFVAVVFMLKR